MRDLPFPSDEADWTSRTPEIWAKVRTGQCRDEPRFKEALESLLPHSVRPCGTVSGFGSYVLLHSIQQNLWTLRQNIWLEAEHFASCLKTVSQALGKWEAAWEGNLESSLPSCRPHNATTTNSAALLSLTYMWCGADFSPVRAAILSHNAGRISQSMEHLHIPIERVEAASNIAAHALRSLKSRVKLGMALEVTPVGCCQSLEAFIFSVECCEYKSPMTEPLLEIETKNS
jgi:hypothetical protein